MIGKGSNCHFKICVRPSPFQALAAISAYSQRGKCTPLSAGNGSLSQRLLMLAHLPRMSPRNLQTVNGNRFAPMVFFKEKVQATITISKIYLYRRVLFQHHRCVVAGQRRDVAILWRSITCCHAADYNSDGPLPWKETYNLALITRIIKRTLVNSMCCQRVFG